MMNLPIGVADKYLLKNVNIIDGKGGKYLNMDITIDQHLIKNIRETGQADPSYLQVYDLQGKWVMPGMIDMHVHLCTETGEIKSGMPPAYWRLTAFPALKAFHAAKNAYVSMMAGFTTLRNCGHVTYYEPEDVALREAIKQGLFSGPRIIASAGQITMTAGHGDMALNRNLHRVPELRYGDKCFDGTGACLQAVREKIRIGADFIKFMATGGISSGGDEPEWPNFQVEEMRTMVSEAHSLNKKIAAHAQGRSGIERVIEAGVDTLEHGCMLDKSLCETMAEKGMFLIPTLNVVRRLTENKTPHVREKAKRLAEAHNQAIRAALETGVKIAFGTDTYNSLKHGENALELLALKEAGMSNMEVLKSATSIAAEALGLQEVVGFIGESRVADLLVVEQDPSENLEILVDPANIKMVITQGKIVKDLLT